MNAVGARRTTSRNFLSTVDVGIRPSSGAPTLDAQGRLVGVFNTLDERDIFLVGTTMKTEIPPFILV